MKIGFAMAFNQFTEPALISDAASLIEEMGAHAVWAPEHVMFFPEYASTYPYSETGRIPGDPEGLLDPVHGPYVYRGTHKEPAVGNRDLFSASEKPDIHGKDGC